VYNEDVSIDFSANVAPFSASLSQAIKQMESFSASADTTVGKVAKLDGSLLNVVKTLGKWVDLNKTSTAAAAAYQQKLAGLATVTALNEKQFKGLSEVAAKFSREFPIGLDKSIDLVKTLQTSGVNTTKSIKELGNAFIKIQAATGEWGGQFVADMLSVNRSFGNSMGSVSKFGDSLVSVSNKFGASAGSVIGFTKALAPFSSAMGMNETSTIGLSTAFSRLGEDGMRSANALNKVMLDLTKSVKTGSPEVRQYAAVMNMTTESLTQLVNTDPAEAVIRFTEAINKQGPKAMNTLNQLGIDGIQTFKSLQTLGKATDLRDILQTSRDSYGNQSASQGARIALGGVNDQMTKMGESMSQTIAAVGTPFLDLITKLLKGMNSVGEVIHNIATSISGWTQKIAPFLAIVKLIHSAFTAIAAIRFAQFLGKAWQNNTEGGQSFKMGREAAQGGFSLGDSGNLMSRMGERYENNMSGIMGKPIKENVKGLYQGAKGLLGAGIAGYMNMTSNYLRADPSEPARDQLITRNFKDNFQGLRRGESKLDYVARGVLEDVNAKNAKAGLPPITRAADPANAMSGTKAAMEALKQFGADLKVAGGAAKGLAKDQIKAGGEVKAALLGLGGATVRATIGVIAMTAAMIMSALKEMAMQAAIAAVIGGLMAAFNSIKSGYEKSNQMHKEGLTADLGSSYNDFAEKAGIATTSITMLASAAREAAHALVMNNKNLDQANKLTDEEIAAARNPSYQSAKDFGKGRSVEDLTNAVLNLQGNSPDAQGRAQLLMDITNQYGAPTANKVGSNLASNTNSGDKATKEKASNSDVYAAGLEDYTRNKDNRWWGGRTDNENSKNSLISIRSNLAQNVSAISGVYGDKAGAAAQVIESNKLIDAAKKSGDKEQMTAAVEAVNEQLGTNLSTELSAWTNKDLKTALSEGVNSLYSTDDQKNASAAALNNIKGVNFNDPNYRKLYSEGEKPQSVKNIEAADEAFKKVNKSATGLSKVFFEATKISLDAGANLSDIAQGGKREDIYNGLTVTQRASVDLANKPNDPVALNTKAVELLNESLKQNKGNTAGTQAQLYNDMKGAASGSAEKNMAVAAYNMNMQQQSIENGGLSFSSRTNRDIKAGRDVFNAGMPTDAEDQEVYKAQVGAAQQAQSQQLAMVKQFVEARHNLDIQLQNQQEDYQKATMRSNRDFNLQLSNQDADYRKSVRRANEDFKLQRQRQSEDFAKSVYSPFQRVAAVRTTDASSLVGNLKNQNKIIKEQMQNLAKLKKLGLTQQSIDTLDLMNPANAQEVARLLRDMSTNKGLIDSTNAEVKTRNNLATKWENSTMNQASNRSTADFKRNMARGEEDYTTAVERAVAAHKQALSDMAKDLHDTRIRAFKELARFGTETEVTAKNAKSLLAGAFDDMPAAAKTQTSAALTNLKTVMASFKPVGITIPTNIAAPTTAEVAAASRGAATTAVTIANQAKLTAVEGSTGTAPSGHYAWYHNGKWHEFTSGPYWESALWNGTKQASNIPASWWKEVKSGKVKNAQGNEYKFADGGIVRGPGTGRSDSIPARLSNGEYVVQADAVRKYGKSFLDNVNAQKLAHASYVHGSDSKMSSMQGYASNITNNTSTQFDQSTQIHGPITVQSNDPNQFMRQMQAKKRFARLTQPAGN